ncbi:MAG TPA: hypothetical protein VGC54_13020 [Planctomycetota bacterium]
MAEPKTKKNKASVKKFLDAIPDATMREDSWKIVEIMAKITKDEPAM